MNDFTHSISSGIAGVFETETKLEQKLPHQALLISIPTPCIDTSVSWRKALLNQLNRFVLA